ncbi:hypothetical protein GVAV_000336 [Gurleya vavrai]
MTFILDKLYDYNHNIDIYENKFDNFKLDFLSIFDDSENDEIVKNKFKIRLEDADKHYFANNFSNEIENMINLNLDDLLQKYKNIFSDIQKFLDNSAFRNNFGEYIKSLYYLDLLNFENITNLKKDLENLIIDFYKYVPNYQE